MMQALVALLLAGAAGQASSTQAYPLAEVLTEARSACAETGLPAAAEEPAQGGWTRFDPEPNGWFADYVARHSEGGGGMKVASRTFTRTVAGRTLYAFVARMRLSFAPDADVFSCEIFDPAAPQVTARVLAAWARRAPKSSSGPGSPFVFASWDPGLGTGIDETTITSAPAEGAPAAAELPPGLRYGAVSSGKRR
jgi:hypothetical protein